MTIIIGFASMEFLSAEHFDGTFFREGWRYLIHKDVCGAATFMDTGGCWLFPSKRKVALITLLASSRNGIKIIVCG